MDIFIFESKATTFSLGTNKYKEIFVHNIQIGAYNDSKHINLNDKEEQQLWITKNW